MASCKADRRTSPTPSTVNAVETSEYLGLHKRQASWPEKTLMSSVECDDEAFQIALQTEIQMLMETTADGWTELTKNHGILLETKTYPFCPISAVRASVKLDFGTPENLQKAADLCWNLSYSDFHSIDPHLLKYQTLEQINENQRVREMIHKLPWPISPRQTIFQGNSPFLAFFLILKERRTSDQTGHHITSINCSHPASSQDDKYVRATLHSGFWALTLEEESICLSRIAHLDPQGEIPSFVVNMNLGKIEGLVNLIRKLWKLKMQNQQ